VEELIHIFLAQRAGRDELLRPVGEVESCLEQAVVDGDLAHGFLLVGDLAQPALSVVVVAPLRGERRVVLREEGEKRIPRAFHLTQMAAQHLIIGILVLVAQARLVHARLLSRIRRRVMPMQQ